MKLPNISNPLKLFAPASAQPALSTGGMGGSMMFASSSGGSGGDYDPDDYDYELDEDSPQPERRPRQPRSTRASGANSGDSNGRSRTAQFQPEERYWTDYLRIALPVIGLLLMIGLLWYWAQSIINDDPNTTEPQATESIGLVTESTPAPTQVAVETPPPANQGAVSSPAAGSANTADEPTTEAGAPTDAPAAEQPVEEAPQETSSTFTDGQTVVVTEPLNLRPEPSATGDPVAQLAIGDELTIVGGPEEGEDYVWWEVLQADGTTSGWVVEDFIEAAE